MFPEFSRLFDGRFSIPMFIVNKKLESQTDRYNANKGVSHYFFVNCITTGRPVTWKYRGQQLQPFAVYGSFLMDDLVE